MTKLKSGDIILITKNCKAYPNIENIRQMINEAIDIEKGTKLVVDSTEDILKLWGRFNFLIKDKPYHIFGNNFIPCEQENHSLAECKNCEFLCKKKS